MCLCVSTPITTRRRRGLSCMLVMLLIPSFDRTDDATLAGRVDGTVTRLRQSGSYEVTARPASTTGGAPAGRRQINSKDTQTGGGRGKQEPRRLPTPNILTVLPPRPRAWLASHRQGGQGLDLSSRAGGPGRSAEK